MVVSEIRPIDSKKALIVFDEEPSFRMYKGEIRRYHLKEGMDITGDLYLEILNKVIKPRCYKRAMFLLAKKDYTVRRLKDKLLSSEYPETVIDSIISELINLEYLNDVRFAENYIRFRVGNVSLKTMKQKLSVMGISSECIDTAVLNLKDYNMDVMFSDEAAARKDFNKKLKRIKDTDKRVIKNKIYSFMASKGYSYNTINSLIDEYLKIY